MPGNAHRTTRDPTARAEGLEPLAAELIGHFSAWEERPGPWPEGRFEELALRAFRLQFDRNPPYRRYCEARGTRPEAVGSWREVPAVPTEAFRAVPLVVGGSGAAQAGFTALEFLSSGTTRGRGRRSRHLVPEPELYRASLRAGFATWVMMGEDRLRILTLLSHFTSEAPSSLAWMGEEVARAFGRGEPARPPGRAGFRWEVARRAVEEACEAGEPLCLLATTLALDEWLRRLDAEGFEAALPRGSRLVDTGGAKGREGLERERVVEAVERRLAIPPGRIFNEFGMTELLSQRYSAGAASPAGWPYPRAGVLYGPPWLRTRALDPVTLEERPEGEAGLLCHFDLANAGSVCAVLTEDMGRVRAGGVEWIGRVPGAPPRGCSLATAELLAAQRG